MRQTTDDRQSHRNRRLCYIIGSLNTPWPFSAIHALSWSFWEAVGHHCSALLRTSVDGRLSQRSVMTVHLATNILEGDTYAEKYDNAWKGIWPGRFHVSELFRSIDWCQSFVKKKEFGDDEEGRASGGAQKLFYAHSLLSHNSQNASIDFGHSKTVFFCKIWRTFASPWVCDTQKIGKIFGFFKSLNFQLRQMAIFPCI